jgi:hypothetical protein
VAANLDPQRGQPLWLVVAEHEITSVLTGSRPRVRTQADARKKDSFAHGN